MGSFHVLPNKDPVSLAFFEFDIVATFFVLAPIRCHILDQYINSVTFALTPP